MGVLTKIRNGVIQGAAKSADGVASLAKLSPNQVKEIDNKRVQYLSEMPSMDDRAIEELTKKIWVLSI